VERLCEGARALGIGELDGDEIRCALLTLAEAAFGTGDGIVRLQASRDAQGSVHLLGAPRALGPDRFEWSAVLAAHPHGGSSAAGGTKVSSRLAAALASDAARSAGADEALLVDAAGYLVEGGRSNVVVVLADGRPATPPLHRGAVAGIARALALERLPEIAERDVRRQELFGAREIVATNAVRGARAITRLDDRPVADGAPGPWAHRLRRALSRD
jgi:branched-subunit amino acid aminotransferase/4-amino-4-deoxychorismate lyase